MYDNRIKTKTLSDKIGRELRCRNAVCLQSDAVAVLLCHFVIVDWSFQQRWRVSISS